MVRGSCGSGVPWWGLAPLVGDELVQPAHLALDRLEPVALQLERVLVGAFAAAGDRGRDRVQPLLEAAAATLQEPRPDLGGRAGEEGEPDAEALVLPARGAGLVDQRVEVLL